MKRLLLLLLSVILLPITASADDRVLVLSGLPIWDSAPLLHMVKNQPLAEQDIRFEFRSWGAPEELGTSLVREDIHVASAPSILAPIFAARGLELDLLGTSAPNGNIKIVSNRPRGEIAVPFKGGLPDLILQSLNPSQTDENRVLRYTGTPPEAMQLLLAGQVSAAFLAEPLATVIGLRASTPLETQEICPLWMDAHSLDHCPATGVYLGAGLSQTEVALVGSAIADAHLALADDHALAATLLQDQFPELQSAPLAQAFATLTPAFQGMCQTEWLSATLTVLEPLAPYTLADSPLFLRRC